jgi:subtilisin family serine protease
MKKIAILFVLVLTALFSAKAQRLLPLSVEQFLEERACMPSMVDGYSSRFFPSRVIDGCEMVDAFIGIKSQAAISGLQAHGVVVNCIFDGFVTAQVPVDRLTDICRLHGVTDVQVSDKLELSTNTTLDVTHVNEILNGQSNGLPRSYDGTGVIVGVIDVGFDYQHRAFRSNQDNSRNRIVRVYSTTDKTGHTAYYNTSMRLPGSVFMGAEIYNLTTDKREKTHGTHTASIAAGSHVNGYGGMAPGADIVLCAVSELENTMSAVEVANCVRYIDSYADSVCQPCVISLSVSTPSGQRDGQDYLSKVINQTMGPGRIFVIAAGNNGNRKAYAHKLASPQDPLHLLYKYENKIGGDSSYYYAGLISDIWVRQQLQNFYYKIHVLDLQTGNIVWESNQFSSKQTIDASELGGYYECYTPNDTVGYIKCTTAYTSDGKKYRLSISIHNLRSTSYTPVNGVRKSRYAIGLSIYPRREISTEIDAWICNSHSGLGTYSGMVTELDGRVWSNYYAAASDSCSINNYAVGDSIISAGAYCARNTYFSLSQNKVITDYTESVGHIASFSGYQVPGAGPTGKALPTICAPGVCVIAAGSRYSYFASGSTYTSMVADGSYWGVMTGTSMAAPTVAGIIALWLQANPNLSVSQVMDILAQTGVHDKYTDGSKRDRFGPNGKIDALAGLQVVLSGIPVHKGDVNLDGEVDIIDVSRFIDYLLGKDNLFFDLRAGDINGDGQLAINDMSLLVDALLTGQSL